MVRQDPHQGGTLSEMAPEGTTVPNDAGKMNTIPSVPRPDQRSEHHLYNNEGIAEPSTATAVDNATDLSRSTRDRGMTGEVISGTGDTMPADVESKRTFMGSNIPGGTGNTRDVKRQNQNRSQFDRYAKEDQDSAQNVGEHEARNA